MGLAERNACVTGESDEASQDRSIAERKRHRFSRVLKQYVVLAVRRHLSD
jgi:hypothetical protein